MTQSRGYCIPLGESRSSFLRGSSFIPAASASSGILLLIEGIFVHHGLSEFATDPEKNLIILL